MRRTFLLLLLLATPVFAQSPERWRASVLRVQHGYGAAIAYAPSAAWDFEAGVGERSYVLLTILPTAAPAGQPVIPAVIAHEYSAHPLDLFVTRHFAPEARVSPYVRAGARYVEGRGERLGTAGDLPVTRIVLERRPSVQVGAGARVRLTPRTALRLEAARLLRSDAAQFDPLSRVAAGVSWQF